MCHTFRLKNPTLAFKSTPHLFFFRNRQQKEERNTDSTLAAHLSAFAQKSRDGLKRFRMRKMAIKLSAQKWLKEGEPASYSSSEKRAYLHRRRGWSGAATQAASRWTRLKDERSRETTGVMTSAAFDLWDETDAPSLELRSFSRS